MPPGTQTIERVLDAPTWLKHSTFCVVITRKREAKIDCVARDRTPEPTSPTQVIGNKGVNLPERVGFVHHRGAQRASRGELETTRADKRLSRRRRSLAERVGFEPTCRLPDKTLSRRPRYDHFGTSPDRGVKWNVQLYTAEPADRKSQPSSPSGERPRRASGGRCGRSPLRGREARQQDTHLWLFLAPSFSSSAIVSGNGSMRWTGPFAMSAVVWPARFTRFGSAPFDTR